MNTVVVPMRTVVEETATCACTETLHRRGWPNGPPVRVVPLYHSCEYVNRRNLFIPVATRIANTKARSDTPEWSGAFHQAMNKLVRDAVDQGKM